MPCIFVLQQVEDWLACGHPLMEGWLVSVPYVLILGEFVTEVL